MSEAKKLPKHSTPAEGVELAKSAGAELAKSRRAVRASADDLKRADRIVIEGLEVFANHGVYPEENALGQKFTVSLTLYTDLSRAGETDDLDASIDYGRVCHMADSYLREHTFKLIEAAAEGLAAHLLAAFPLLLGIRVKLEKPWAPIGLPLSSVGVEIERTRS